MTLWMSEGKVIVDGQNQPIDCDHCPCDPPSSSGESSSESMTSASLTSGSSETGPDSIVDGCSHCEPAAAKRFTFELSGLAYTGAFCTIDCIRWNRVWTLEYRGVALEGYCIWDEDHPTTLGFSAEIRLYSTYAELRLTRGGFSCGGTEVFVCNDFDCLLGGTFSYSSGTVNCDTTMPEEIEVTFA